MLDDPLKVCPKDRCQAKLWGKGKVKRVIAAGAGLIFKGSGFYITDYRSDSYKEAAKKDVPATAGGGKAEGAKSGAKGDSGTPASAPSSGASGKESKSPKPGKGKD
jgi:predicted nucleic acid-binding Zn ribbon protein